MEEENNLFFFLFNITKPMSRLPWLFFGKNSLFDNINSNVNHYHLLA